eukprot:COSAG01_NODE_8180_length_2888_cov_1.756185_2_plen_72_part_00
MTTTVAKVDELTGEVDEIGDLLQLLVDTNNSSSGNTNDKRAFNVMCVCNVFRGPTPEIDIIYYVEIGYRRV